MAKMAKIITAVAGLLSCAAFALPAAAANTLEKVKNRGTLECGVSEGLYGFSEKDAEGRWSGFDVDFCRAVAAAIFNDPQKVKFTPLSAS